MLYLFNIKGRIWTARCDAPRNRQLVEQAELVLENDTKFIKDRPGLGNAPEMSEEGILTKIKAYKAMPSLTL